jgi:hypothetical protein
VREWGDVVRQEPADGDTDVLLLGPHPLGPRRLPFPGPVVCRHEATEVFGMLPLDVGQPRAAGEALGRELAHRCQHAEPRSGIDCLDLHKAVPDEGVEQVQDLIVGEAGDVHGGVHRPALDEDREHLQHLLLRSIEQPEAPLDGRAQRALTLRQVRRAGAEGVEAVFEPSEQRTRFQQSRPSRRELDGEGETFQAPADLHDVRRVLLGQGEVVADGLGPVDEQAHGR